MSAFPPEIESFVIEHIGSVEQLEILLLLRAHASKPWTGESVAQELRLDPTASEERLLDLLRRGFVVRPMALGNAFSYSPNDPALDKTLGALAGLYPRYRNAIIRLIFSKPSERVQSFMDAVRASDGEDDEV